MTDDSLEEAVATEKFLVNWKPILARFDQRIGSILADMSCVARFYTIDKGFVRALTTRPADWPRALPVNIVGSDAERRRNRRRTSGQFATDAVLGLADRGFLAAADEG